MVWSFSVSDVRCCLDGVQCNASYAGNVGQRSTRVPKRRGGLGKVVKARFEGDAGMQPVNNIGVDEAILYFLLAPFF